MVECPWQDCTHPYCICNEEFTEEDIKANHDGLREAKAEGKLPDYDAEKIIAIELEYLRKRDSGNT